MRILELFFVLWLQQQQIQCSDIIQGIYTFSFQLSPLPVINVTVTSQTMTYFQCNNTIAFFYQINGTNIEFTYDKSRDVSDIPQNPCKNGFDMLHAFQIKTGKYFTLNSTILTLINQSQDIVIVATLNRNSDPLPTEPEVIPNVAITKGNYTFFFPQTTLPNISYAVLEENFIFFRACQIIAIFYQIEQNTIKFKDVNIFRFYECEEDRDNRDRDNEIIAQFQKSKTVKQTYGHLYFQDSNKKNVVVGTLKGIRIGVYLVSFPKHTEIPRILVSINEFQILVSGCNLIFLQYFATVQKIIIKKKTSIVRQTCIINNDNDIVRDLESGVTFLLTDEAMEMMNKQKLTITKWVKQGELPNLS